MYAADHDGEPTEFAAAFDVKTGDEVWRVAIDKRYEGSFGDGPRSTPAVDGKTVYDDLMFTDDRVMDCLGSASPGTVEKSRVLECIGDVLELDYGEGPG